MPPRGAHNCLLRPHLSPVTQHLRQLPGNLLTKFVTAIEFISPRQKVGMT